MLYVENNAHIRSALSFWRNIINNYSNNNKLNPIKAVEIPLTVRQDMLVKNAYSV